ncbi:MAG: hypothetical protein MZW92_02070 [Comamonadaceae bacterium]|nr:hypothetical protein [Comamonadaceae bacterium]
MLYGRNIVESLMVKEAKAFMAAMSRRHARAPTSIRAPASPPAKATRYWQVRPNSDYALNLAPHPRGAEAGGLRQGLRRALRHRHGRPARRGEGHHARMAGAAHRRVPPQQLRAFVQGDRRPDGRGVIFHPGWMTARHKQSFHVSRTALILNALMGNIEIPGGFVIGQAAGVLRPQGPEAAGSTACPRSPSRASTAPAPRGRPWDPAIGMLHQLFAAMETAQPYGIGAYFAYRHDPLTAHARRRGAEARAGQARSCWSRSTCATRRPAGTPTSSCPSRPTSSAPTSWPAARPGAGVRDARPGDRAALRQPPGVVDLPRDPAPHGHQGGARLRDHRGDLELPARGHRRHRRRDARDGRRRPGRRAEAGAARRAEVPDALGQDRDRQRRC